MIGPLARTVRDAAALLDVQAVSFVGDPFRAPPPEDTFLSAAGADPGRLRIGGFTTPVVAAVAPSPEVLAAVADTVELPLDLGRSRRVRWLNSKWCGLRWPTVCRCRRKSSSNSGR